MITSAIGKIFLDAYNEEYGTHYDARTFFIEQFYPLFFDHNKYMMHVTNSPFVQGLPKAGDCLKGNKQFENETQRKLRLKKFLHKVEKNEPDASIAIGYPTLDITKETSGQITDLSLPISSEDVFASWIGDALGIGVQGGFSILFSQKQILLDIFRGWQLYRRCLNNISNLKGNQINTWNGQWLSHFYDSRVYDHQHPLANFNPFVSNDGIMSLQTQTWTKVLIGITRKYEFAQLMGYIYNIGKTNTTIGFIPFDLTGIRKPIQLYKKLFANVNSRNAEELWGTAFGFKTACSAGTIGIKAMEPKGLADYINQKKQLKAPKNEEEQINFNVYKIWILAMLNNEQMWDISQELAEMLCAASTDKDKTISTKRKNLVENVLLATNKQKFIAAASELMNFVPNIERFRAFVKEIHSMPSDNVPYFLTLVRFHYKSM